MFRIAGVPQVDAAEEKRRVRESVKKNIFTFAMLVAAIRIGNTINKEILKSNNYK